MCEHLDEIASGRRLPVVPSARGCEDCLEEGTAWVHLRLCLACGHLGCCDSSPRRHATRHFRAAHHPVIKSFEPGEDWAFCYVHEEMASAVPAFPEESPAAHLSAPERATRGAR
jgi:uncharacterized UBP type Zn finger protein